MAEGDQIPPQQPATPETPPPAAPAGTPPPPAAPGGAPAPVDYGTGGTGGYPGPYAGPPPSSDDRTMALLAHVLGILTSFLGPLIIWLMKKEQSAFVDDQGKETLNFQLTLLIGWIIAGATTVICIGPFIGLALMVIAVVFGVMGAMAANKGQAYRYPINIRFIK